MTDFPARFIDRNRRKPYDSAIQDTRQYAAGTKEEPSVRRYHRLSAEGRAGGGCALRRGGGQRPAPTPRHHGQASAYLALRKAAAPKVAAATALCIVSPVTLLLLSALSESGRFGISGNAAAGIGLCVLLVLVAVAVSLFLRTAAQVREFKFLEEEPFETEYGVDGMVRQRQQEYKDTNTRLTTVGVVLCVLAAVPLFAVMCIDGADLLYVGAVCALLALVAVGCLALVTTGVYQGAMEQLLEEGDYTRPQKKHHKLRGTVTMIYWLAATAVFLLYTYGPHGNGQPRYSWIIWAVAGVLYAAVMGIVRIISRSRG